MRDPDDDRRTGLAAVNGFSGHRCEFAFVGIPNGHLGQKGIAAVGFGDGICVQFGIGICAECWMADWTEVYHRVLVRNCKPNSLYCRGDIEHNFAVFLEFNQPRWCIWANSTDTELVLEPSP